MAETESTQVVAVAQENGSKQPRNPFSLFPRFELKLPLFNRQKKSESVVPEAPKSAVVGDGENEKPKPIVVSFPKPPPVVTPLESEFQESSGTTHNPVIIWQVYALGGFIIMKWIWARWNERNERAKKASSDDNQSPDDAYQSPGDDNE